MSLKGEVATVSVAAVHGQEDCKRCGACVPLVKGGPLLLLVKAPPGVKEGDRVIVEVILPYSSRGFLFCLLLALALFVAGTLLGSWVGELLEIRRSLSGIFAFLGGILFMAPSFFLLYLHDRKRRGQHTPVIVERVEGG